MLKKKEKEGKEEVEMIATERILETRKKIDERAKGKEIGDITENAQRRMNETEIKPRSEKDK